MRLTSLRMKVALDSPTVIHTDLVFVVEANQDTRSATNLAKSPEEQPQNLHNAPPGVAINDQTDPHAIAAENTDEVNSFLNSLLTSLPAST